MIQEIEDRFRVMKRLGAATNSQILIAKDRQSGQDVVIKVFNGTSVPHEVQVLYSLCHPSIVSIYQTFSTQNGTFCMAMPMLGKREMDLFEYVEECGPLPEKSVISIFSQLLSAIIYLHHHKLIAHCDIKVQLMFFTIFVG